MVSPESFIPSNHFIFSLNISFTFSAQLISIHKLANVRFLVSSQNLSNQSSDKTHLVLVVFFPCLSFIFSVTFLKYLSLFFNTSSYQLIFDISCMSLKVKPLLTLFPNPPSTTSKATSYHHSLACTQAIVHCLSLITDWYGHMLTVQGTFHKYLIISAGLVA
jgi:hypothetical protein